jgi:DNA-binding transcriptional ArsR family regulator
MRRDVFQAIADPTRRQILQLLSRQQLTLNGITEHFDVSRPAISKHIRILTECGLVTIKQQGRERYCQGELGKLREVAEWLKPYETFWNNKLDALEKFLGAPAEKKAKHKK